MSHMHIIPSTLFPAYDLVLNFGLKTKKKIQLQFLIQKACRKNFFSSPLGLIPYIFNKMRNDQDMDKARFSNYTTSNNGDKEEIPSGT